MGRMTQQWDRLGASLKAGREALRLTQAEVAQRIGIERNSLRLIETGTSKRVTNTIRAYAREIGWADGSIEAVLAGGEPEVDSPPVLVFPKRSAEQPDLGLSPRLYRDLQQGHVLENVLIDLTPSGSLGVAVVLIERPGVEVTEEQQAADMRTWSRVQRQLLQLMAQQDPADADA